MLDSSPPDPSYQWAVGSDPDRLVVQLPPLAVTTGGRTHDAMRALFRARAFAPATAETLARPPAANGCALVPAGDEGSADLVVTVGPQVGATRLPVPHGDPAWSARVTEARQVQVLVTEAALDAGTLTEARLADDVAAGGVLVAVVPVGALSAGAP